MLIKQGFMVKPLWLSLPGYSALNLRHPLRHSVNVYTYYFLANKFMYTVLIDLGTRFC